MNDKFTKPYDPQSVEKTVYSKWEQSGYFNPDNLPARHQTPFSIVMPPPNANGDLHVGHSLFITLEDIMIRYKRMCGYKTLWIPGADHAGFETQIVYEKKLEKEGRSRFKMDPHSLYKEIYDFTLDNKEKMENQVRSMGASCDWSREKFTLDADVIKKVQQTFAKMYDDGLVYRGDRMVNWCTKHQTSLSDVETESIEKSDKLYYIKYGPVIVATVRPETIFGDVAIAVNPEDSRYKHLINTSINVETPIGSMTLSVIGDASVDAEFGTGALKITPAHDKHDFEIGLKHNLPTIEVINQYGKMNEKTGKYCGMKILEARKQVVEDLQIMGLLEKIEDYKHLVPTCYKCGTTIEPRKIPQWYVKMKPLAKMALDAVEDKKIRFHPDNYRKIFNYWMSNTNDWNISRQIIWGIPIPAKICNDCGHAFPDLDNLKTKCEKCSNTNIRNDSDTFDTWFSSGQWPLVTTGYPDSKDFQDYYPTNVMETGYDLIFKWIPRMVIFGLYLTNKVPFTDIYLHGLINDAQGKKMSKSKGNVINPLDMTAKYGTDALRMALVVANPPGSDASLSESKIKGYKNFSNKIWNITRFILSNTDGCESNEKNITEQIDHQIISEFNETVKDISSDMENFRYYLASEKIYHYVWHRLANEILEDSKVILNIDNNQSKVSRQNTLLFLLRNIVIVLHPFMPFVTEEIWGDIKRQQDDLLLVQNWPV